jgi:hypothetical protein
MVIWRLYPIFRHPKNQHVRLPRVFFVVKSRPGPTTPWVMSAGLSGRLELTHGLTICHQ